MLHVDRRQRSDKQLLAELPADIQDRLLPLMQKSKLALIGFDDEPTCNQCRTIPFHTSSILTKI
jgi:hypothetical protein